MHRHADRPRGLSFGGRAFGRRQARGLGGALDRTLRVWDVESGHCTATLAGHEGLVSAVALSADGRRAVSGSHDRTLRVWEVEGGRCTATLAGYEDWVTAVALSADGRRAVACSNDRTLRVWDSEGGHCIINMGVDGITCCALSADGRRLFLGDHAGNVSFLEVAIP